MACLPQRAAGLTGFYSNLSAFKKQMLAAHPGPDRFLLTSFGSVTTIQRFCQSELILFSHCFNLFDPNVHSPGGRKNGTST
jgi:hypothetical protein